MKQNRLSQYEQGVIDLAEAWERAHLMGTGRTMDCEQALRRFIRDSKRDERRNAALRARGERA